MISPELSRIRNIIEGAYEAVDDCCSNTPFEEIDELVCLANNSEKVKSEVVRYLCNFAENTPQSGHLLSYIFYRLKWPELRAFVENKAQESRGDLRARGWWSSLILCFEDNWEDINLFERR